ncbi:MAG: hypothetical protein HZC16_02550 [Candidatus Omnitrophica bacterium]|nr:hypothetical protein [Candidatus Omnitrophota bacterium]
MKKTFILLSFLVPILSYSAAFAVETAPRISDREIIEGLANVRGDIKELRAGQNALQQQINDLKESTNKRFDDMNNSVNKRFDTLQWMLGLFITIALFLLGIVVRILWNQRKQLAEIETSLETQKDEISFLKNLIEKLLPPKGLL